MLEVTFESLMTLGLLVVSIIELCYIIFSHKK